MKVIQAQFKGEDGSMGFRTGKVYKLEIVEIILPKFVTKWKVMIMNTPVNITCPYTSWDTFKQNWDLYEEKVNEK